MLRYPKATWHGPIPNEGGTVQRPIMGVVLHVMEGSIGSADNWFHDPAAQASAHMGNPKVGAMYQWVDLDAMAWAEMAGNPAWVSVENEGMSGELLNANQLQNLVDFLVWLHQQPGYSFPLVETNDPTVKGLGWHGMGGVPWGNHPDCPGQPIVNQRPEILQRVQTRLAALEVPVDIVNVIITCGSNGEGAKLIAHPFGKLASWSVEQGVGANHIVCGAQSASSTESRIIVKGASDGQHVIVRVAVLK